MPKRPEQQNPNHMGGPSFYPDLDPDQKKRASPPAPAPKGKADTQILKDEDIPPL